VLMKVLPFEEEGIFTLKDTLPPFTVFKEAV
jgi:hypothetical protein